MKKVISALLAITLPIWILPAAFLGIIAAGVYETYKQFNVLLWGEK